MAPEGLRHPGEVPWAGEFWQAEARGAEFLETAAAAQEAGAADAAGIERPLGEAEYVTKGEQQPRPSAPKAQPAHPPRPAPIKQAAPTDREYSEKSDGEHR